MASSPSYVDVSGITLSTLGSNPQTFAYLPNVINSNDYPPANVTATLGPMKAPRFYAKDLNLLEIGSSGQVVMSLQDQASVSFKNIASNTISILEGANNNAFFCIFRKLERHDGDGIHDYR